MKRIYLMALGLLAAAGTFAQKTLPSENVGIGTQSPDHSAVLDLQSSDKGLLIPRLSLEQRNGIKNPANGLMIYQTSDNSGFYFYNGSTWKPLSENDAKSIATLDVNGWALDGNATATANKAAASAASFIGTPAGVPINFKIGGVKAGQISSAYDIFLGISSGLSPGTGNNNIGLGGNSLENLVSGSYNSAIGSFSLNKNTTGSSNTGLGTATLRENTTGGNNVAMGTSTLQNNISGGFNTGVGATTLWQNTTGNYNTAIGYNSLKVNTVGSYNLGLGFQALIKNTTGQQNIALGSNALNENLTGSGNIAIGHRAGFFETGSNKLYIHNTSTTTPLIYGDFSAKYVTIGDVTPALRTQGTATGGYNLLVKGGILTEKVKVALAAAGTDWADYVFEPEYKRNMMSLEEVEQFTLKNKHLPNVPSAEEMVKGGLDVSQTSKMFMEKIEELTLYMIELNKEVKALKAENAALKGNK